MPRDLFGDVTHPSISVGTRKWYTVPLSLLTHSAIVLAVIAIPLLAPAVMPSVLADNTPAYIELFDPPKPPPSPAERPTVKKDPPMDPSRAPTEAPPGIARERPQPEARWEDRTGSGLIIGDADPRDLAPPPPVVTKPPAPVRVGGTVRTPMKTRDVSPVYPPIAQSARVQGIVIIEATISEGGQVVNARILRSVPFLDQAALDAVRQWQFTPTLLNGVPVPVIMTVTVNFTLQ